MPVLCLAKSTHPHLYADKSTFRKLARSRDKVVTELREIVLSQAGQAAAETETLKRIASPTLWDVRMAQGRLLNLSAAYNLSGDNRYLEAARRQISVIFEWEDWGTSHFLDIGESAFAVGVAYDWLYPALSKSERQTIEQNLVKQAFDPSFLVSEGGDSWLKGNFNWNQVCHGGLAVAALAIYDSNPEVCRRIVERAAECVPYAAATYAPDGAYPEGPSYWEYGTTFQVLMMEAMRSALGHCYGLEKSEGFLESADFKLQVCVNTGLEYAYSDYHRSVINEPVMMWYARELGRKDIESVELEKIRKVAKAGVTPSRHTVFDLLWYSALPEQAAPAEKSLSSWFARGEMPLAIMRTDKEHNDAYAAFKGGTADNSHGHMDSGSFIYESQGVRWALDLGTESYDRMSLAGLDLWNYQPQSTRWTTFRPSSESHNILRVNGAPLVSTAKASDMSFTEGEQLCSATLDITPLYSTVPVLSAFRTVSLDKGGNFTVQDEISASGNIVAIFQWVTDADVIRDAGALLLAKDGRRIRLSAPDYDSVFVEDVSAVPGIQNSPNPGVKRILFVKKLNAGTVKKVMTVTATICP